MSNLSPDKEDYVTPDGLKVAQDVAWVFKSLWGLAVAFAIAIAWGVTLANDVKTNTSKVDDAATKAQVQQVLDALVEIKGSLNEADRRQRTIQSQIDKLETKVDTIEKRDE